MLMWTPPYGVNDPDRVFVMKRHYGPYVQGSYNGSEVELVDLVQGILSRIIRPDDARLLEVEAEFSDGRKARHISQASLNEEVVAAAEAFQQSLAHLDDYVILWATNGSTANDMAIRIAIGFTRGSVPFYLKNAYHGANALQNANCGAPGWSQDILQRYLKTQELLRTLGIPLHIDHAPESLAQQLTVYKRHGIKPIFVFEDIQGVGGGFAKVPDELLRRACGQVQAVGGIAINDAVQTLYRRGKVWSVDDWGRIGRLDAVIETPDIITGAKAVANGEAVAFVAVKRHIAEDLYTNRDKYGLHWDTFSHNARNLAVAHAVLNIYQGDNLGENLLAQSAYIRLGLEALAQEVPEVVKGIRGHAGMIGVELPDKNYTTKTLEIAPEHGLYFGRGGERAQILRLAPHADFTREASERTVKGMRALAYALRDSMH